MKLAPGVVLAAVSGFAGLVLLAYLGLDADAGPAQLVEPTAASGTTAAVSTPAVPTPTPSLAGVLPGHTRVEIAASKDTTLYENESVSLSNGAGSYLFIGRTNELVLRRALVHFDVAAHLPPGARVAAVQVVLHLSRTGSGPQSVSFYRVTNDWAEGGSKAARGEGEGARARPGDATWQDRAYEGER